MSKKQKGRNVAGQQLRLSKARLDDLVEEALVDAYGESEQVTGFYTMMENDLQLPFETEILRHDRNRGRDRYHRRRPARRGVP